MKAKIILFAVGLAFAPVAVSAQKHAPETFQRTTNGIWPEASKRNLTTSDLRGLTSWDLKIMRNEIYARHGYIFQTADMQDYFADQPWYDPRYKNIDSRLSKIEKRNIAFIKKYE